MTRLQILLFVQMMVVFSLHGQNSFTCEGQVWAIEQNNNSLLQVSIGSNGGIDTITIKEDLGVQLLALGFRSTDQMLYGVHPTSHDLYRIDVEGNIENLSSIDVDPTLLYLAGDVSPDGSSFMIIGSDGGMDSKLYAINLADPNYSVEEFDFDHSTSTVDISFHPSTSVMFGFDSNERRFYSHSFGVQGIIKREPIFVEHDIKGIYFDAFANMYGIGTALFGGISGLFAVDKNSGETELLSTTGKFPIGDVASCPYSVELDSRITPKITIPCSELTFQYTSANQTGLVMQNVLLEHILPYGYSFVIPDVVPFGGDLDETTPENILRIENIMLPTGILTYSIKVYVDDIGGAEYKSQVRLDNIPERYGSIVLSNDPISPAVEDSTSMQINRIEEDSLFFDDFLCHGSSITLDASAYGSNLNWSNGAIGTQIDVYETELITLVAESGCQELFVSYEVVSASCPYTIEVRHMIEPDTIFACSNMLFRYILENDSGEERFDLVFVDTLPVGFSFLEIVNNPYQSELSPNLPSNIFQLEKILLKEGIDTIDVLIEVGDVSTGDIRNDALIKGLPQLIGTFRTSDDPATLSFPDSTAFYIKGVENGSLQVDTFLCNDEILLLDASEYGASFLWQNGSIDHQIWVSEIGEYQVLILDGCDTSIVNYVVENAAEVSVDFNQETFTLNQSESIQLLPSITNLGDSLNISWLESGDNSLSCIACPNPIATPLQDALYTILVENEYCLDSAEVKIFVDETRRLYVPTAFSPNGDGFNDFFYLQSPDPATILSFQIFDRWGNKLFEEFDLQVNDPNTGWDGNSTGEIVQSGVYIWNAEIEFFDGRIEKWSGDITVIR